MKLSFGIDYLSSKKLGAAFMLSGMLAFVACGWARGVIGSAGVIALILCGLLLWTREWYIVLCPVGPVLDRAGKVFELLGLPYEREVDRITTKRPRAEVKARAIREFTLLFLDFDDYGKQAKGVLAKALLKVMRQS
jgi:hypothetical protein